MFKSLQPLLAQCQSLTLIMTGAEDNLTVTVIPKQKSGTETSLAQPLQLTGTAEELSEGFVSAISTYSAKRLTLVEQVEAANAILEAAKKAAAEKSSKVLKKPAGKPSTPSKSSTNDDDEEGEETNDGGTSDNTDPVESKEPAPAVAVSADNIFA